MRPFDRGGLQAAAASALLLAAPFASIAAPLDHVVRRGAIRLCALSAALPQSSRADPNGRGIAVELAEAIAHEIGLNLVLVWSKASAGNGRVVCDASMDAIDQPAQVAFEGRTGPLRPASLPVRFTKPYAASGVYLAIARDSGAQDFADLAGEKVGVVSGSIEQHALATRGATVSPFGSQEEILVALDAGEIAAGAAASSTVDWFRRRNPGTTVRIPDGYVPEPQFQWNVAIALWQADDALADAMNAAIDTVLAKGIPPRIYAKYGVRYEKPR